MHRSQQAFTLIELLIAIAIMAILMTLAAPSFYTMIQNNRSQTLGEEFVVGLNTARSEAVGRGRQVSFCASDNGNACGGDWTDGWAVLWVDDDGTIEVLRRWAGGDLPDGAVINADRNRITYAPTGMLPRTDDDPMTATLSVNDCRGNSAREVRVGPAGLVSVTRVDCVE